MNWNKLELPGKRRLQIIWWWRLPTVRFWRYPELPARWYYEHLDKPIFYGLYLGVCEIRYFPKQGKFREVARV